MNSWMLWVWLVITPCDVGKGETCTPAVHDSTKEFFHEDECEAARKKQLAEFKTMKLLRYSATCHKRSGPFLEPAPTVTDKASK